MSIDAVDIAADTEITPRMKRLARRMVWWLKNKGWNQGDYFTNSDGGVGDAIKTGDGACIVGVMRIATVLERGWLMDGAGGWDWANPYEVGERSGGDWYREQEKVHGLLSRYLHTKSESELGYAEYHTTYNPVVNYNDTPGRTVEDMVVLINDAFGVGPPF